LETEWQITRGNNFSCGNKDEERCHITGNDVKKWKHPELID